MTVAMQSSKLEALVENRSLTSGEKVAQAKLVSAAIAKRNDGLANQPADRLGSWPTEDGFGHRVPVGDDAVGTHRDNPIERRIEDASESPQVLTLRRAGGLSFDSGADLTLDDRAQAGKVLLENVVACATAHHGDSGILADGPGDNDERDVEVGLLEHVKGARSTELGQVIVGDDEVWLRAQLGGESPLGINPLPGDGEAGAPQVLGNQQGVIGPVLHDQDAQRLVSLCHRHMYPGKVRECEA